MKKRISQDTERMQPHKTINCVVQKCWKPKILVLALDIYFPVAPGLDMPPCLLELAITADVGRHLGKQPEALTKQCASRLAAETWGRKIGNDGKERKGHRRLEIMQYKAWADVRRQSRAISSRESKAVFCFLLSNLPVLARGKKEWSIKAQWAKPVVQMGRVTGQLTRKRMPSQNWSFTWLYLCLWL